MKIVFTLVLIFACATVAIAQQPSSGPHPELLQNAKSIDNGAQLQEWLNFYYLHPRPDLAPSAFAQMNDNGLLAREDMRPGVIAFLGAVMHATPSVGAQLVPHVHNSDGRYVLAQAAWLANTDSSTDVLDALSKGASDEEKAYIKEMTYRSPPELVKRPIQSEWDLDGLWASFFATGDPKYIQRIASTLGWTANSDPVIHNIGEVARRTLARNAVDHPRVLEVCKQEMSRATNAQKDSLAAIVSEAQQANRTH